MGSKTPIAAVKIGEGAIGTVLRDVRCEKMWGDGFYVGGGEGAIILDCVADKNRRQGVSIVHGKKIRVHGCTFSDTSGTAPMAGIDVEPDKVDRGVLGVVISHCKLIGNQGYGIIVNDRKGPVSKLEVGA
jgi:hypothetical protein